MKILSLHPDRPGHLGGFLLIITHTKLQKYVL